MQTVLNKSKEKSQMSKEKVIYSQQIFKYLCIVITLILLYCIKGFITFRNYCETKNIYIFSEESILWCIIGFFGIFVIKYAYFYSMRNKIESIIHPKYKQKEREVKVKMVLKLSYDSLFYTFTSVAGFFMFNGQYWFASAAGGCGKCSQIYKDYPNWPSNKRKQLQIFFMIQLGVHFFSVFEMIVIKGRKQRKYYEFLLHHFVAASLILFSMMSNQIAAGTMILIIHDMSDMLMSFTRGFLETIYTKFKIMTGIIIAIMTVTWIYMRIVLFPFCLLASVYINKPTINDQWYIIHFQYTYLFSMACVLVAMHIYWTYFIIKSVYNSIAKKEYHSVHEKQSKAK